MKLFFIAALNLYSCQCGDRKQNIEVLTLCNFSDLATFVFTMSAMFSYANYNCSALM